MASTVDERLTEARAAADALRDQLEAAKAKLAYLRLLAPQESEPPEPAKSPPRRTRVEGHTGIYQRRDASGVVLYEIGWTEAGKQRWRTIGTDLDAAIEARRSVSAHR